MLLGYFWANKYAIVPLIPWPTRWTGFEEFSIVCLIRLWTTSTSHDSSRSCSNDHLLTSKCWPKLCAVRLKRQYRDGWRSIQSIWLVLIWFYFSYFLMLLNMVSLREDDWLYFLSHPGWSSFHFDSEESTTFPCLICSLILFINFFSIGSAFDS